MNYLKCNWCATNAATTIRLTTGKLTGICHEHLQTTPTTTDAYGTKLEVGK